jgi:hypothetical protein
MILGWMLPKLDGVQVARRLPAISAPSRRFSRIPRCTYGPRTLARWRNRRDGANRRLGIPQFT